MVKLHSLHPSLSGPLGVPASFVLDAVGRASSAGEAIASSMAAVHEYRGARGFAFQWGQIVERDSCGTTSWFVVPVSLWESLHEDREGSRLGIPDLVSACHRTVRDVLRGHLPPHIVLTGCQGGRRLRPHSLFALMAWHDDQVDAARTWLSDSLLRDLLPGVLSACEAHVGMLLASVQSRASMDADAEWRPAGAGVDL